MTDKDIIDGILQHEGSAYTNVHGDRGGPTRYGITLKTLAAWRKVPVLPTDVQLLTEEEARAIYQHEYIIEPGFSHIADDALRVAVIDAGVNSGPGRATEWLQLALGVTPDGVLGVKTLGALDSADATEALRRFLLYRLKHLAGMMKDKSQHQFAAGWLVRVMSFFGG